MQLLHTNSLGQNSIYLTLSVLRPLAAIVLGHFSGNFTQVLIHAKKIQKGYDTPNRRDRHELLAIMHANDVETHADNNSIELI
jgi:hypothetical protein